MKKRRLTDLYATGRPMEFNDGEGPVEIWIQKPGVIEHEACLRRANAARARALMIRNNPESEEWQATYSEAADIGGREPCIDFLVRVGLNEKRESIEAEVASRDEWSKDDYLQGLLDSWNGDEHSRGLKDEFARDSSNEDAKKVLDEMTRYNVLVEELMEPEYEALKRDYESESDEELTRMVTDKLLESKADAAWMRELNRAEIFYALRDADDHTKRYFDIIDEVDMVAPKIMLELVTAYREFIVDPTEGKGSEGTVDSSSPSEAPEAVVEDKDSGPLAVVQ